MPRYVHPVDAFIPGPNCLVVVRWQAVNCRKFPVGSLLVDHASNDQDGSNQANSTSMAPSKPKSSCAHQRQAIQNSESTEAPGNPRPCEQCKAESHRALVYRLKLIAGLLMPFALQALDVTMCVSTNQGIGKLDDTDTHAPALRALCPSSRSISVKEPPSPPPHNTMKTASLSSNQTQTRSPSSTGSSPPSTSPAPPSSPSGAKWPTSLGATPRSRPSCCS